MFSSFFAFVGNSVENILDNKQINNYNHSEQFLEVSGERCYNFLVCNP